MRMNYLFLLLAFLFVPCNGISGLDLPSKISLPVYVEPKPNRPPDLSFTATFGQISKTIADRCKNENSNCDVLEKLFCSIVVSTIPTEMKPTDTKLCYATANILMKEIRVQLFFVNGFDTAFKISAQCPTFAALISKALLVAAEMQKDQFSLSSINDFLPPPDALNKENINDAYYVVDAKLCDKDKHYIHHSKLDKTTEDQLLHELKIMSPKSGMGKLLYSSSNVVISNLSIVKKDTDVSVSYRVLFPKSYVEEIKIDPTCDTASILQLTLNSTENSGYTLCNPRVEHAISTTETPKTTPGLASTCKSAVNTIGFAFATWYTLVNM